MNVRLNNNLNIYPTSKLEKNSPEVCRHSREKELDTSLPTGATKLTYAFG